jgi:hypothetical protein
MDEYFIGAGALLTAGPAASIASATLHAQAPNGLAGQVQAAVIDFEGSQAGDLSRILVVAAGWSAGRFRTAVVSRLLERRECDLADVIEILAEATGTREVHLFARWLPDEATGARLAKHGLTVFALPLEAIGQAALVSGQRVERWIEGHVQAAPRVRKHDAA